MSSLSSAAKLEQEKTTEEKPKRTRKPKEVKTPVEPVKEIPVP